MIVYDIIIIGLGPAAISAGIYATRREMKTLIIGKELGGQIIWASEIENYPGFLSIQSYDLIQKMAEQIKATKAEIKNDEVKSVEKLADGNFKIYTGKEDFTAKAVIIAMGLQPRRLAIPGEIELTGKGVSYCANCDGPFYRDKTVAVIGGGNSALDAAEILSKIAKKVYLIHRREEFRGFEVTVEEIRQRPNVEIILSCLVTDIIGGQKIEKIKLAKCDEQSAREIAVDGLFIEIGRIAATDLVAGLVERNENGQIMADARCRTRTPGVFAAGDVTDIPYKQITIACGQGAIAALAAYEYLQLKGGKTVGPIFDRGKK